MWSNTHWGKEKLLEIHYNNFEYYRGASFKGPNPS